MLQQTQVAVVEEYFRRWMVRFPTVESLARAPIDEVLRYWSGLGYYRRARNLHAGANWVILHGMPKTREAWLEVPGVGPYTAGAVCSIGLGQREALVDGNVERVFSRWHLLRRTPHSAWDWARSWITLSNDPGVWNQALMELGATLCTPKNPRCHLCPVQENCRAWVEGKVEKFPEPKVKPKWKKVSEDRVCALSPDGKILVERGAANWRKGLWDLPEKLPFAVKGKPLSIVCNQFTVTSHKIKRTTRIYGTSRTKVGPDFKWIYLKDLSRLAHGAPLKKLKESWPFH